jgi:hypothetical protein
MERHLLLDKETPEEAPHTRKGLRRDPLASVATRLKRHGKGGGQNSGGEHDAGEPERGDDDEHVGHMNTGTATRWMSRFIRPWWYLG